MNHNKGIVCMFLYTVPTGRAVLGMPQYGAQSQSTVATKSQQDLQLEVKAFYYILILRSISLQVLFLQSSPAVNSSVPSPLGKSFRLNLSHAQ